MLPHGQLPWVKKCIDVTKEWWDELSWNFKKKSLKASRLVISGLTKSDTTNVVSVFTVTSVWKSIFPSRGTCLLQHVQLGACNVEDLRPAFIEGMRQLVDLHGRTGVGDTGEYLHPEVDRQVGLGLLGLANFLAIHGVSYAAFGEALGGS